jgi:hypothetical protein
MPVESNTLLAPLGLAKTTSNGSAGRPVVEYLVLCGSSVTYQSFADNAVLGRVDHAARKAFTDYGIDLPVIVKAVPGSFTYDLAANIATYIAELGPVTKKCAFLFSIGSNNIGLIDYDDYSAGGKSGMIANLTTIVDTIEAAGHIAIMATTHIRQGYVDLWEEWADRMYRPLIKTECPKWYSGPLAVFDYVRLYKDNDATTDWYQVDGIHPNVAADGIRKYTAAQLVPRINAPAINKKERHLFGFALASAMYYHGGINTFASAASGSSSALVDANGKPLAGTLSWSGAAGGATGRGNLGEWGVNLENHLVQNGRLYGSAPFNVTYAAGAAYANRTGTLRITMSTATASRQTRYTLPSAVTGVIVGFTGVTILDLPFVMNGAGTLVITCAPEAPSTVASLSGLDFVFD